MNKSIKINLVVKCSSMQQKITIWNPEQLIIFVLNLTTLPKEKVTECTKSIVFTFSVYSDNAKSLTKANAQKRVLISQEKTSHM